MNTEEHDGIMSADRFAHLGEGHVAYVRKMRTDDLIRPLSRPAGDRPGP